MRVYRIMFSILDLFLTTFTRLMLCGRDPVKVVKGWRSPYYKHIKQVMDFSVFNDNLNLDQHPVGSQNPYQQPKDKCLDRVLMPGS